MTLAGRDSGDLSLTFRDLKSFGARLSDLSRTLAGDPKMRVSDLKLSTLNVQLPVLLRVPSWDHGVWIIFILSSIFLLIKACRVM